MSLVQIVALCLAGVCVILAIIMLIMLGLDMRRERAEAELDRRQQDVLLLAAQLSNELRDRGLDGRVALIREARRASGHSPAGE